MHHGRHMALLFAICATFLSYFVELGLLEWTEGSKESEMNPSLI